MSREYPATSAARIAASLLEIGSPLTTVSLPAALYRAYETISIISDNIDRPY
jgi:hypothetical protein